MRRLIGVFALMATLLAVFGTAAHQHDHDGVVPADCAVCVAAHHAPAALTRVVALATPIEQYVALVGGPQRATVVARVHRTGGRAPPRLPLV